MVQDACSFCPRLPPVLPSFPFFSLSYPPVCSPLHPFSRSSSAGASNGGACRPGEWPTTQRLGRPCGQRRSVTTLPCSTWTCESACSGCNVACLRSAAPLLKEETPHAQLNVHVPLTMVATCACHCLILVSHFRYLAEGRVDWPSLARSTAIAHSGTFDFYFGCAASHTSNALQAMRAQETIMIHDLL